MNDTIIQLNNLKKYFESPAGMVKAVDGVSFKIYRGETLGIVGESGCGKSTLARSILRLIEPSSGEIILNGQDITNLTKQELQGLRKKMSFVFQDPHSSLNPRMTVYDIISRPLIIHGIAKDREELTNRIVRVLKTMGLQAEHMIRFPHELSGGQKQRVGIARSFAVEPEIVFLDEPTSALDVSVQTKILKLLSGTKDNLGLTYVFISHDINLIRIISDRIAVMYLGKIVEIGDIEEIFTKPAHPYTCGLFKSVPEPDPDKKITDIPLIGEVPSPINPPQGCNFHPRCPYAEDRCRNNEPNLESLAKGRKVACHFAERILTAGN